MVLALTHSASAQQSTASFAKAIANQSTAPSYVLVTVINDNAGTRQTICTLAPFLLGAISSQYHILPDCTNHEHQQAAVLAWERKLQAVALASKDRVYHFSNPKALKNLRVRYTPQELAQVRRRLSGYSTQEIITGLSSNQGKLHHIYDKQSSFSLFAANRDALAYVLLERGLQVGQGDMTGGLFLIR